MKPRPDPYARAIPDTANEWDYFTAYSRRLFRYRPHEGKEIKRGYWARFRRMVRGALRRGESDA